VSPERARELAVLFVGPRDAVVALLLESQHGEAPEVRARAWQALMALDPDTPLPSWALGRQPDALEQLTRICLLYLYGLPADRGDAAALLSIRCGQAIAAWERERHVS
jgi:hypothetical protein